MAEPETECPVCHDRFPPSLATFDSETPEGTVWFCSVTCKQTFDEGQPPRH